MFRYKHQIGFLVKQKNNCFPWKKANFNYFNYLNCASFGSYIFQTPNMIRLKLTF